jgi:hypothetical protein
MTTTPYYRDHILATMPDRLEKDVYCIVRFVIGKRNAVSKEFIALTLFQKYTPTTDRQIREAVETLHEVYGLPVCTNSGTKGYYMPKDREELNEYLSEVAARRDKLDLTYRKIYQNTRNWNYAAPVEHVPTSFEAVQLDLIPMSVGYA